MRDDGFAGVALKAGDERQCPGLAGLGVGQHLRAVDPIEREGGAVNVCRTESRLAVRRVDAALGQSKRRARRQVVDDDNAGGASFHADRGASIDLIPNPAAMIGARYARRWRHKQRRPFARRTPFVISERVVVQEEFGIWRARIGWRLEDENLSRSLLR